MSDEAKEFSKEGIQYSGSSSKREKKIDSNSCFIIGEAGATCESKTIIQNIREKTREQP
jgi:hypothetical protein